MDNKEATERPDSSEEEEPTAAGILVPPRDEDGTPSTHDEDLTEEAEEAVDTEVATGHSVDSRGRPFPTNPPPTTSD